ncbi:MAG: tRNA epoxyqueuosine(34) reductase QueG [Bacteroidetes bacterium]|nr:tRNA epoxyqueuosine(34) reductase QueG [Bacteroidota bacterium]
MLLVKESNASIIKSEALKLGFSHVGISKAGFLEEEAPRLEQWLAQNRHGKMSYMENWFDKRLDPRLLVDGAKSVISLLLNYYPSEFQNPSLPKISKYAYGRDYHFVIKEKLKELMLVIQNKIGDVHGRAFVDSAPVLDRAWAKKSGLGWIGKNGNLIHPKSGSFFFIAELIVDLDLDEDAPISDYCGTCTRCMDACPTEAIVAPMVVDGSKCISYFTIELKEAIPKSYESKMDGWAFGCDVCQDVCPWNKFSKPHQEEKLKPITEIMNFNKNDWKEITEDVFKVIAKESPLLRPGLEKIKNTILSTLHNGGKPA